MIIYWFYKKKKLKVFEYKEDINGSGKVVFAWSQDSSFIVVCGDSKLVYVLDKYFEKWKINYQNEN